MKIKLSQERKQETKLRVKKICKTIVKYAIILIFTFCILMILPRIEKYIIYAFSILVSARVLMLIKNKYISINGLGLGKTRKALKKEINIYYLRSIIISIIYTSALVLIDYLVYHLTVDILLLIYLYLIGLYLFTLPINCLINVNKKIYLKVIDILIFIIVLILSAYVYFDTLLYYLSYIILFIMIVILFIIRELSYKKKDL